MRARIRIAGWPLLVSCAIVLAASSAQAANIVALATYPAAVPSDGSTPAIVVVRTGAAAASVELELDGGGGTVPLVALDAQTFSAILTPAQLLANYTADDVFRHVVGHFKVDGVVAANFSINIDDAAIPNVPIANVAADMRYSSHVVNLLVSAGDPWQIDPPAETAPVLSRFYEVFGDDFDFADIIYSLPSHLENRFHSTVKNQVLGIGLAPLDDAATYGSAGRLQGFIRFPLDTYFDLAESSALHEIGHQWINALGGTFADPGAHWPPSTMARGIMGWSGPSFEGIQFPFDLLPQGDGTYLVQSAPLLREFTSVDLYLMGLLPPDQVEPFVRLNPNGLTIQHGALIPGAVLSISDVIAAGGGARVPDAATAPHTLTMATIVVSRSNFLSDREMAFFDYFAARGEATTALPFSIGLEKSETKPFNLATRGIGTLVTAIPPPLVHPPKLNRNLAVVDLCKGCPEVFLGLDIAVFSADIRVPGVRNSLRQKIQNAGAAYGRGQRETARNVLGAFLKEVAAQNGHALSSRTARSLDTLIRQTADQLGIGSTPTVGR